MSFELSVRDPAELNKLPSPPKVHCLVHPGFDKGDHPEFEAYIHAYIEYISKQASDVLLMISDGEIFDHQQIQQFAHMDMIEGISLYLGLHDGGMGDLLDVYDKNGKYSEIIKNNGLGEHFYKWCKDNIDMTELKSIATEWRTLQSDYLAGKYKDDINNHNLVAANLRKKEEQARIDLDILNLSIKALDELGPINTQRNPTHRKVRNSARFHRIYQHAMKVLGRERLKEMFIADAESLDKVPIQPVSHFQTLNGEILPTPIVPPDSDFVAQVFNASETHTYGNAAIELDKITYELSLSRNKKLLSQQPVNMLESMNFTVTSETPFIFLGEYRDRCVNNVLHVMRTRLRGIAEESKFFIASNIFTLERPANHVGTDWF